MTPKKTTVVRVKRKTPKIVKPDMSPCKDVECARCSIELPILVDPQQNTWLDCQIVDTFYINGEVRQEHQHLCPQCMSEVKYILKTGQTPPQLQVEGTLH